MAPEQVKVCSYGFDIENYRDIEVYEQELLCDGAEEHMTGYSAARKALTEMSRDEIIDEVKQSGLRGKGGAGFPTGVKWSFMPGETDTECYLAVNGDESEPGTANDREIMKWAPHLLIESCIIASYAIDANTCYVYIRGEMFEPIRIMNEAIDQAYEKGYLGDDIFGSGFQLDMSTHTGAGAYICGEETSMLNSLVGVRGYPRQKPPFPAQTGLFGDPTTVNNVQTLATVPAIIQMGADWHTSMGSEKTPGMRMWAVSGDVKEPGQYEFPYGITIRELVYDVCGGPPNGNKVKAVIPGGASAPMIPGDATDNDLLDTELTYEGCEENDTLMGSGGMMVLDETRDIVKSTHNLARFFAHESCGKCTPCREGAPWMQMIYERILSGHGEPEDPDLLQEITEGIETKSFCALGDAAAWLVQGALRHFRGEHMEWIEQGEGWDKVFQASYAGGMMSVYDPDVQTTKTHEDPDEEGERLYSGMDRAAGLITSGEQPHPHHTGSDDHSERALEEPESSGSE